MQIVGRRVDEVARERRGQREGLATARAVGRLARAPRVGLDDAELGDGLVHLLALVAVEVVRAEDRAFHHRLGAQSRRQPVPQHLGGHGAGAEVARPPHGRRGRSAQRLRGGLGARAEPGDDDAAPVGVGVGDLARLAPELLGVEHALELTLRRAIETRQALRQPRLSGVQTDDERVGGDVLQPLGADVDLHSLSPPRNTSVRLNASPRRIMSSRPWVVSSSATRSMSNHCASPASLPATTSRDSGYAR